MTIRSIFLLLILSDLYIVVAVSQSGGFGLGCLGLVVFRDQLEGRRQPFADSEELGHRHLVSCVWEGFVFGEGLALEKREIGGFCFTLLDYWIFLSVHKKKRNFADVGHSGVLKKIAVDCDYASWYIFCRKGVVEGCYCSLSVSSKENSMLWIDWVLRLSVFPKLFFFFAVSGD